MSLVNKSAVVISLLEATSHLSNLVSDILTRKDFVRETEYYQKALLDLRVDYRQQTEELERYKQLSDQYWTLLKMEGYTVDSKGNFMKLVEEESKEEVKTEEKGGSQKEEDEEEDSLEYEEENEEDSFSEKDLINLLGNSVIMPSKREKVRFRP